MRIYVYFPIHPNSLLEYCSKWPKTSSPGRLILACTTISNYNTSYLASSSRISHWKKWTDCVSYCLSRLLASPDYWLFGSVRHVWGSGGELSKSWTASKKNEAKRFLRLDVSIFRKHREKLTCDWWITFVIPEDTRESNCVLCQVLTRDWRLTFVY